MRSWILLAVLLLVMLNSLSMAAISCRTISTCLSVNGSKDVLKEVHFIVKRFHLQVTQDDVREILAELCQFSSASVSASISLEGVDAHVSLSK